MTFRDKLTMRTTINDDNLFEHNDTKSLQRWLQTGSTQESLAGLIAIMMGLAVVNLILVYLFFTSDFPGYWGITFGIYAALYLSKLRTVRELHDSALRLENILRKLKAVTEQIETYHFGERKNLRDLCLPLIEVGPSGIVRRVSFIVAAAGLRGHPLVWALVNAVVPWDLYFAHRLNQQKTILADRLPRWLDVWFELEALSSLATFAALNPHYTLPDISTNSEAIFMATNIGHPLIPDDEKICNDFAFNEIGEIAMITGSNMSGKSSFLRTLGVNLVLANAGSVVDANDLQSRLFRVFSVIRVTDSLSDGISYFYAEVKRLRALLDALQADDDVPLFFMIDEIFKGTNNRERLIGSRSYIRALTGQNGIGLIATHDLELVRLADENPAIRNYHFRETVADGRMIFDYKLREGPSPTTNALKIMALEGLPVEVEES